MRVGYTQTLMGAEKRADELDEADFTNESLSDVETEGRHGDIDDAANKNCSDFGLGDVVPAWFGRKGTPFKTKKKRKRLPPLHLNGNHSKRFAMLEAWESTHFSAHEERLYELEQRVTAIDATQQRFAFLTGRLTKRDDQDRPAAGQHGKIFNPYHMMVQANRGTLSIKLDRNAWSAALIAPLLDTRPHLRVAAIIPQYAGLLFTVIAQVLFTVYLQGFVIKMRRRAEDPRNRCTNGSTLLRFMCLCVLFASVASTELLEIMSFRRWVRAIPRWNEKEHRKIAEENQTYLAMRRITSLSGDNSVYVLVTGISDLYRFFANWGLVVPRLVISLYMLIFSSGYIVYVTKNEHIFLNTLATLFILDIDNYAYEYLTTHAIKVAFEELPPLGFLGRQDLHRTRSSAHQRYWAYLDDELWQSFGGVALIPLMFAAAATLYCGWCVRTTISAAVVLALCIPATIIATFCFVAGKFRADTTDFIHIDRKRVLLEEQSERSETLGTLPTAEFHTPFVPTIHSSRDWR